MKLPPGTRSRINWQRWTPVALLRLMYPIDFYQRMIVVSVQATPPQDGHGAILDFSFPATAMALIDITNNSPVAIRVERVEASLQYGNFGIPFVSHHRSTLAPQSSINRLLSTTIHSEVAIAMAKNHPADICTLSVYVETTGPLYDIEIQRNSIPISNTLVCNHAARITAKSGEIAGISRLMNLHSFGNVPGSVGRIERSEFRLCLPKLNCRSSLALDPAYRTSKQGDQSTRQCFN